MQVPTEGAQASSVAEPEEIAATFDIIDDEKAEEIPEEAPAYASLEQVDAAETASKKELPSYATDRAPTTEVEDTVKISKSENITDVLPEVEKFTEQAQLGDANGAENSHLADATGEETGDLEAVNPANSQSEKRELEASPSVELVEPAEPCKTENEQIALVE